MKTNKELGVKCDDIVYIPCCVLIANPDEKNCLVRICTVNDNKYRLEDKIVRVPNYCVGKDFDKEKGE